ncbi:lipid-binding SYLF domain-containing protein [Enterovibrio sp. ZSDZ42]|uniref:Lipid-binding SYLF domain-containing protein n=1 Tax=Enterovibrio gelatinilyticus TaxID=2899819 RepID=A0ABT5QXB1_9GAMM|nr:lipid-binding SYLF domain-containing protein [Enterovibrio sp. ZSDZ42]MDD1792639.1 lipid-binding SYLF domain-containing protein [Enterovibrio sp. ZSDZ42]
MHAFFRRLSLIPLLLSAVFVAPASAEPDAELFADTRAALANFHRFDEVKPFFDKAYGYAVFPSVGKGGFWIGGAYGNGLVYQGNQTLAQAELIQISIGFTFGGQAFSEILFFEDKATFDSFMSGSFELGAQASATALTEGAAAHVGTTGTSASAGNSQSKAYYINGTAIFTQAKGGLMVEAALAGQKFNITPLGN